MVTLSILLLLSTHFALGDNRMTAIKADELVKFAANKRNLCPTGWFQFNSSCFMFVATRRTWAKAERHCMLLGEKLKPVQNTVKYLGPNLASVHSSKESQFLEAVVFLKTESSPLTWIGGFDHEAVEKDRLWFWSDGSKFDHENWAEDKPSNNGARKQCIQMNFGDENGWTDESCLRRYPSLCSIRTCEIRHTIE